MNKKQIKEIHRVLLPLWKRYDFEDIKRDIKDWNINDEEGKRRLNLIQEDFREEAERSIAKLDFVDEWNQEHEEEYPDSPAISTIINQYVHAFYDSIWDEEGTPTQWDYSVFIHDIESSLAATNLGKLSAQSRLRGMSEKKRSKKMKELVEKRWNKKADK